jgi:hypothetical protein
MMPEEAHNISAEYFKKKGIEIFYDTPYSGDEIRHKLGFETVY